ncbi:MAG TPA: SDR family NAD(P)-dependent oxidoreductase [Thiothrix sp.]|nr:SDR family NAD(P)-dependent oxidoreductase [Thiothrix sp.]
MKKIAWLIGASSGIGKALAMALAQAGWTVAISARREEKLNTLNAQHANLHVYPVDVTNCLTLQTTYSLIETQLGALDLCIYNAGDYQPMPLAAFNPTIFEQLNQVNYLGAVNTLACLIPNMTQRGRGQILLTASLAAYRGLPKAAPYNASKAALLSLAESLHPELKQQGVLLRVINPGFVRSALTDKNDFKMPFLMDADQAAAAIMRELPKQHFEIRFPKRFAWLMGFLACLPYRWYFSLTKRMV